MRLLIIINSPPNAGHTLVHILRVYARQVVNDEMLDAVEFVKSHDCLFFFFLIVE